MAQLLSWVERVSRDPTSLRRHVLEEPGGCLERLSKKRPVVALGHYGPQVCATEPD